MRHLQRPIAGVLTVWMTVQATGCVGWKTVTLPEAVAENPKHKVQVVLREGGKVAADSVRARGDTVVTYQPGGMGTIALTNVSETKVRRFSLGKTIGLVVGLALGFFIIAGISYAASPDY